MLQKYPQEGRYLNCDEPDVRQALTEKTSSELINYLGNHKLVVIDEAQRVKNIGLTLKLITDNVPKIQIVATGSSSFDLSNKIKEPLTGRVYEFLLYPLSTFEITDDQTEIKRLLESRLIYGTYPEIVTNQEIARETLQNIYKNYYKNEPFVKIMEGKIPEMHDVQNTNYCCIGGFEIDNSNQLVVVATIDNLIKGAAGQAVQNMNLMFGFDEKEGLV